MGHARGRCKSQKYQENIDKDFVVTLLKDIACNASTKKMLEELESRQKVKQG